MRYTNYPDLPQRPYPLAGLYLELVEGYTVEETRLGETPVWLWRTSPDWIMYSWDANACNCMMFANGKDDSCGYAAPLPWIGNEDDDGQTMNNVLPEMRKRGYRLRLVEYSDGWYATFAAESIDAAPWLAEQMPTHTEAVAVAAIRLHLKTNG